MVKQADWEAVVTANEVLTALRVTHAAPEWVFLADVANGTGMHARRRADAIAMNLWPSRGLEVKGFEIKVSRGDLKRELAEPEKADAVARYCDTWWIAAPKGLVQAGDLPLSWGLVEVTEKGARTTKAADRQEAAPLTRHFVAALARAVAAEVESMRHTHVPRASIADQLEARYQQGLTQAPGYRERQEFGNREKLEAATTILAELGIDLTADDWRGRVTPDVAQRHVAALRLGTALLSQYGDRCAVLELVTSLTAVGNRLGQVIAELRGIGAAS